jgi:hypothetical protein
MIPQVPQVCLPSEVHRRGELLDGADSFERVAKDIHEIVEVAVVGAEVYTSLRLNTSEFGS